MNVPEEWVPSEAEVPADHWSKSTEWLAYKAKQSALEAQLPASKSALPAHMQVGTIKTETRKKSTHEIQMEACRVEWVDPNPPEEELTPAAIIQTELAKHEKVTDEILADIARTILARIDAAVATPVEEDAKAG